MLKIIIILIITLSASFRAINCNDLTSLITCSAYPICWQHLNIELIDVIQNNRDNHTEACDNFYQYACGNWAMEERDNFEIVINVYAKELSALLIAKRKHDRHDDTVDFNEHYTNNNNHTNEKHNSNINNDNNFYDNSINDVEILLQNLRDYLKACSETQAYYDLSMERYLLELPKFLRELKWPNWHMIVASSSAFDTNGSDTEGKFDWLIAIAELRRFGLNGVFFEERIGMAFNDSTKFVIELKMPNDAYDFDKKFELVNYLVEFNLIDGVTDATWTLAAQIFAFEIQLKDLRRKAQLLAEETLDNKEESLTLDSLKQRVANIDWQQYFNILLSRQHVDKDLPLEVNDIKYLEDVAHLIEQTEPKIVSSYILMRLCKYLLDIKIQNNAKNCVEHMTIVLPLGMSYVYNRFFYNQRRHQDTLIVDNIFSRLKMQFSENLNSNKLRLNERQIQYLQTKLSKMHFRLGNLPENASDEFYNHYYDEANITATNFHFNHWSVLLLRFKKQHDVLSHNGGFYDQNTFYVNDDIDQVRTAPYFVHERNLIIVPMLFMQAPFFHHSLHPLFHYSLIGFILGHEMNHAFEMYGLMMDAFGNEAAFLGSSIKEQYQFKTAVDCFQQFSHTNAINERIADINGFQLAYDAYFNSLNSIDLNMFSNSTDFSIIQLYFLNFAQFFCGTLPMAIQHDRDDVRVNEVVANMPEFLRAFKCSQRSARLNRGKKQCQMWRN